MTLLNSLYFCCTFSYCRFNPSRIVGSVTGLIYGSPNFDDGERVETSPIVSGDLADGNVVKTGTGSRYFLSSDDAGVKAANKAKAVRDINAARRGATITLGRGEQKEAEATPQQARGRPTFSIFGAGGGDSEPTKITSRPSKSVPPPKKLKKAPSGVPSIVKWRKNFDGSITGFISGSPNFAEGEKVTTSPISGGTISSGQVVQTGSGSKYFLV